MWSGVAGSSQAGQRSPCLPSQATTQARRTFPGSLFQCQCWGAPQASMGSGTQFTQPRSLRVSSASSSALVFPEIPMCTILPYYAQLCRPQYHACASQLRKGNKGGHWPFRVETVTNRAARCREGHRQVLDELGDGWPPQNGDVAQLL